MKTLLEQRAELLKRAESILAKDDVSGEQLKEVDDLKAQIVNLDERMAKAKEFASLKGDTGAVNEQAGAAPAAKTLGEHFFATKGDEFKARSREQGTISAPMYEKAYTDVAKVPEDLAPVGTDFAGFFEQVQRPLQVRDLLGTYNLSGHTVTYFELQGLEGTIAENIKPGELKSQVSPKAPIRRTETLSKIAAFWETVDEMLDDVPFLVSGINNQLTYQLQLVEENALLNGDGSDGKIKGLLNRDNVQTVTAGSEANQDALYEAITKVQTGSGLAADGLIVHPDDYQKFRLAKDANGQYYAGGYFYGEYGNTPVVEKPGLWGLRTVVTPAIAKGTALVGSFRQGAQVADKKGLQLDFTNSHGENFTKDIVTFRLERRELLLVPRPAAFVKVTLGETFGLPAAA